MNILITGGTGFIGSALTKELVSQGAAVTVLSRKPAQVSAICGQKVRGLANLQELNEEDTFDVIINLAGAGIFDWRWTSARKLLLRDSRMGLTAELLNAIKRMQVKPGLLISGSAIGYYGNQADRQLTEQTTPITDFSQKLCADWENAALQAQSSGVRVCLIRTGLVLAKGGGLMQRMLLPFQLGLGGRLGDGQQWMSWIHRDDWIKIALTMIDNPSMSGAYNATAPNPVTNAEFTQTLARCVKRPALLPIPGVILKVVLGEMAELVLGSQRVLPERLLEQGFQFDHACLENALQEILSA
jgi:uncharacterized protein